MAQLQVGDKVRVKTGSRFHAPTGTIKDLKGDLSALVDMGSGSSFWVSMESIEPIESTTVESLTITATLTSDTIPTELIKQLSEAGFLITIKAM